MNPEHMETSYTLDFTPIKSQTTKDTTTHPMCVQRVPASLSRMGYGRYGTPFYDLLWPWKEKNLNRNYEETTFKTI